VKVFRGAPFGKAAGGIHIGSSRVGVVDLGREKLEETARGFSRRREERRSEDLQPARTLSHVIATGRGILSNARLLCNR
jgi:hypothetical protein